MKANGGWRGHVADGASATGASEGAVEGMGGREKLGEKRVCVCV